MICFWANTVIYSSNLLRLRFKLILETTQAGYLRGQLCRKITLVGLDHLLVIHPVPMFLALHLVDFPCYVTFKG